MTTGLQVKQSQHGARVPVRVFELVGEMDSNTSEQFQKEVQEAIDAGARYVMLDFSQLHYISSAGLRVLFKLAQTLSAKGEPSTGSNKTPGSFKSPYLKLFNPTPTVHQALEVMGFTMSIEIHNNLNEVLSSF